MLKLPATFFALTLLHTPPASADDVHRTLREALESQAVLPEAAPRMPTAYDPHVVLPVVVRQRQAIARVQSSPPANGAPARAELAREVAAKAAETAGKTNNATSDAPGQVRAADVRQYGNVKKQGNSSTVGDGNGQGSNNGKGNGNGGGKGSGKGK